MKFTLAYVIWDTQYRKRPKNNAQKTKFKRNDSKKQASFVGYFTSNIVN